MAQACNLSTVETEAGKSGKNLKATYITWGVPCQSRLQSEVLPSQKAPQRNTCDKETEGKKASGGRKPARGLGVKKTTGGVGEEGNKV